MTRYHVLVHDDLAAQISELDSVEGFRFIEPSAPGNDGWTRWWLVEDDNAPAELEQHRVDPEFLRHDDGRVTIIKRHIVNERLVHVREPVVTE